MPRKLATLAFLVLVAAACKDGRLSLNAACDTVSCTDVVSVEIAPPPTDRTDPQDDAQVQAKARSYVELAYGQTSTHWDAYNIPLPTHGSTHTGQGDALARTASALAIFHRLQAQGLGDYSSQITRLWTTFKTHHQDASGYLIRHPDSGDVTMISRDAMTYYLWALAEIKASGLTVIPTSEIVASLEAFTTYGKDHGWDYAAGKTSNATTTVLSGRENLCKTREIFGLGCESLSLSTSLDALQASVHFAQNTAYTKYMYRQGSVANAFANAGRGAFGNKLLWLGVMIAEHHARLVPDSSYAASASDRKTMLNELAGVGVAFDSPNWLFVASCRKYTECGSQTQNDVKAFILQNFPSGLPGESNPVKGWGCTDDIWQRVPVEACDNTNEQYLGEDMLLLYTYSL